MELLNLMLFIAVYLLKKIPTTPLRVSNNNYYNTTYAKVYDNNNK